MVWTRSCCTTTGYKLEVCRRGGGGGVVNNLKDQYFSKPLLREGKNMSFLLVSVLNHMSCHVLALSLPPLWAKMMHTRNRLLSVLFAIVISLHLRYKHMHQTVKAHPHLPTRHHIHKPRGRWLVHQVWQGECLDILYCLPCGCASDWKTHGNNEFWPLYTECFNLYKAGK